MSAGMSLADTDDFPLTVLSAACISSNGGDTQIAAPVSAAAFRKPWHDISIRLSFPFFHDVIILNSCLKVIGHSLWLPYLNH